MTIHPWKNFWRWYVTICFHLPSHFNLVEFPGILEFRLQLDLTELYPAISIHFRNSSYIKWKSSASFGSNQAGIAGSSLSSLASAIQSPIKIACRNKSGEVIRKSSDLKLSRLRSSMFTTETCFTLETLGPPKEALIQQKHIPCSASNRGD